MSGDSCKHCIGKNGHHHMYDCSRDETRFESYEYQRGYAAGLEAGRAAERAAVLHWLSTGAQYPSVIDISKELERGDHTEGPGPSKETTDADRATLAPHAGECALCRAPWQRAVDGSSAPSCGCVKV